MICQKTYQGNRRGIPELKMKSLFRWPGKTQLEERRERRRTAALKRYTEKAQHILSARHVFRKSQADRKERF